jgi:peptidoglycan/xylan/chitin deacetylase (PgdA/CDA1 family)
MIASVRIGYSVSQHYGAPQFARAITNRLAKSLEDQKVQIVAVFKAQCGCGRFQPPADCLGPSEAASYPSGIAPAGAGRFDRPSPAPTAGNSACILSAICAVLVTAGELTTFWWQRHLVQATRVGMTARRVTLSFDNGPTAGVTERVLDILGRARILTTFFVIGRNLDDPAAVSVMEQAHAAGHWIGNHTLTHSVALGDRPDLAYAVSEIEGAELRIGKSSHPEKLFRPYGNGGHVGPHLLSRAALDYLLEKNFRTIIWNNVPGDWRDPNGWVERCVTQVSEQHWSVVVLHDIASGCAARLDELLRRLDDLGVTFEQDFPDAVTITRAGRVVGSAERFLTA